MKINVITLSPQEYNHTQQDRKYSYYKTAAGVVRINMTKRGIVEALFVDDTFVADNVSDTLDGATVILSGTVFQIKVWQAIVQIPAGSTITYQELACMIGHPQSWRAVANALGKNKIAYFVPCHRAIRKNGELGGYAGGLERKKMLLESEKLQAK
jgi:O-6-methylguanine DNA methyltransferase